HDNDIACGCVDANDEFEGASVPPLAGRNSRIEQLQLRRQIAKTTPKDLLPGFLDHEHIEAELTGPKSVNILQFNVAVQQKLDSFQPCRYPGFTSGRI